MPRLRLELLFAILLLGLLATACSESDEKSDGDTDGESGGTFPPESQTPLYTKGLILPVNSLPCIPVSTGVEQTRCNHHGSTVAELPDGTVAALWYHGEEEKSKDSRLVWSRLAPGETSWTWPEVVFDDPDLSEGNATLWVGEDGTLYIFFVTIFGNGWDETHVRLMRSHDNGATWDTPVTLREQYCFNVRHRPLRLANGELLLPLYHECLGLPVFMRSGDDFQTWTEEYDTSGAYLMNHVGQIQPALIGLPDGKLACITRDGTATRRIKRMESSDYGKTWTESLPLGLPNAGTSVDWVRLLDGHVVVVFNNDPDRRFPLTVALSRDEGKTFVAVRDIVTDCEEGGDCSHHYPSIMQSQRDGTIWVTYTHKRETIGWVHFNEAWLLEGTEKAFLHCFTGEQCSDGFCFKSCAEKKSCDAELECVNDACRQHCQADADCGEGLRCDTSKLCIPAYDPERKDANCQP